MPAIGGLFDMAKVSTSGRQSLSGDFAALSLETKVKGFYLPFRRGNDLFPRASRATAQEMDNRKPRHLNSGDNLR
jgi:hypothetical protein